MGCLVGLIMLPFNFFRYMFTNGLKGYIIGGVVLVGLLVGFFVIRGAIHEAMTPDTPAAVTQQIPLPARDLAPYEVKTHSRTYYAYRAVKDKDGTVTMTDYYELLGGRWTLTKGVLVLDKNYGTVTIRKRLKGQ